MQQLTSAQRKICATVWSTLNADVQIRSRVLLLSALFQSAQA